MYCLLSVNIKRPKAGYILIFWIMIAILIGNISDFIDFYQEKVVQNSYICLKCVNSMQYMKIYHGIRYRFKNMVYFMNY